jgi:hypothetical protein
MPSLDARAVLKHSLAASQRMIAMFTADLSPADMLHRPCPGANCAAWIVGHLILTERMLHRAIGVTSPALPEGFEAKFARDEVAPKLADYGDVSSLPKLFDEHRAMSIAAIDSLSDDTLAAPLEKPHPMFKQAFERVNFLAAHVAMHAGQISSIRRSLGRPALI